MPDLHARLLAEIERREEVAKIARTVNANFHHPGDLIDLRGYLWALEQVVNLHHGRHKCRTDNCRTLRAVATGLGVEVDG